MGATTTEKHSSVEHDDALLDERAHVIRGRAEHQGLESAERNPTHLGIIVELPADRYSTAKVVFGERWECIIAGSVWREIAVPWNRMSKCIFASLPVNLMKAHDRPHELGHVSTKPFRFDRVPPS